MPTAHVSPAPLVRFAGATGAEIGRALACLSLVVLVFAAPALHGDTTLSPESVLDRDPLYRTGPLPAVPRLNDRTPATVDLPRNLTIARLARTGWFPKWNPWSACGTPLWAELDGPFFPLKLPVYLAPSPATYVSFLCLRLLAAGLGAYLLARYRGIDHWPALGAGAVFELSGPIMEFFPFGAFSATAMLPWSLLGAAAIARRRDGRGAAGAALALGSAASSGHPTITLVVFAAFAAAIAGHLAGAWRRSTTLTPIAAWSAVAVVLGLCLAAPGVLALSELSTHATSYKFRPSGTHAWLQGLVQSRATAVPALIAPHVLAAVRAPTILAHALAPAVGVITLVLAIAGVLKRGLDAALIAVLLLGVSLTVAPPVLGWIYALPLVHVVIPYYAWALVALPLAQAAGTCLQNFAASGTWRRIALALLLVAAAIPSLLGLRDVGFWFPLSQVRELAFHTAGGLLRLVLPFAVVAAALGAASPSRQGRGTRAVAAGLGAAAVAELLWLWLPLAQQPRARMLAGPPSPAVAFLHAHLSATDGRLLGLPLDLRTRGDLILLALGSQSPAYPISSMLVGLADARGLSALPITRYLEYMESIDPGGSDFVVQETRVARSPLVDLAAVRYVVEARTDDVPESSFLENDPRMPLAYSGEFARIYENQAALPRVRITHQVMPVRDAAAARTQLRLASTGVAHADERPVGMAVFVEPAADGRPAPALQGAGTPDEQARIVDASHPDRLVVDARLDSPGLLVIADTYYPGWRAWVDGAEVPIFPADLLFRGVPVPAGSHIVELRYDPWWYYPGLALMGGAALLISFLWVGGNRAGAPRRVPAPAGLTPQGPLSTAERTGE